MSVVGKVVCRLGELHRRESGNDNGEGEGMNALQGQEEDLRTRALAAGATMLSPRGCVAARAVDLLRECIVGWDSDLAN